MNQNNNAKPIFNLPEYLSYFFWSTFISTRWRQVIVVLIFLLQFVLPAIVNSYIANQQEGQFSNIAVIDALTQKGNSINLYIGCVKYIFLLLLLLIPPANPYEEYQSAGVGCLRVFLLCILLITLPILDLVYWSGNENRRQEVIHEKSFDVNQRDVYARVVYSSYYYDSGRAKSIYSIINNATKKPTGYIVVAQINNDYYHFPHLEDVCKDLQTTLANTYFLNKPSLDYNYETCYLFSENIYPTIDTIRVKSIPGVGQYVKIYYDPYKKYIKPFTYIDSHITPVWDSFPGK